MRRNGRHRKKAGALTVARQLMASLLTLEQLTATRDSLLASYNTLAATPIEEYSLQDRQVTYQRKAELWAEITRLNRLVALRDPKIRAGGYAYGNYVSQKAETPTTEILKNGDFAKTSLAEFLTYTFPTSPNNGHANDYTFTETERPQIIALESTSGLIKGNYYYIRSYNVNSGNAKIFDSDGSFVEWSSGRGSIWQVVALAPDNWTITQGTLDQDELAKGKTQGDGGAVHIQQTFDNLYSGTYKITIERADISGGAIAVILTNSVTWGSSTTTSERYDFDYQTTEATFTLGEYGINSLKVNTANATRAIGKITLAPK